MVLRIVKVQSAARLFFLEGVDIWSLYCYFNLIRALLFMNQPPLKSQKEKKRIVVGMSGGIDSSVALILLKKQGYNPVGVSLRFARWENEKNILKENVCCTRESFEAAEKVCRELGVKYIIVDARRDFQRDVIEYFLRLLREAKTPNPCLVCNKFVKIKTLLSVAKKLGADQIATGHYAKVTARFQRREKIYLLQKPKDKAKDQTYFLALLGQRELSYLLFPLADYTKDEVRRMAAETGFGFLTRKRQSQDLCFVANEAIPDFLKTNLGFRTGKIRDTKGRVLGEHNGLHFYTFGQRKGLNLPGGPFWVVGFDLPTNTLIVSRNPKSPALFKREVLISGVHYISAEVPSGEMSVEAKTRYKQEPAEAVLIPLAGRRAKVVFSQPQRAPTPGQWLVFYQGDTCLGAGLIEGAS